MRKTVLGLAVVVAVSGCGGQLGDSAVTTNATTTTTAATTTTTEATTTTTLVATTRTTLAVATTTTTVPPLPELDRQETAVALTESGQMMAQAWLNGEDHIGPMGLLKVAARELLTSHLRAPSDLDFYHWQSQFENIATDTATYGGFPVWYFTALSIIGVPGVPATINDGAFVVGDDFDFVTTIRPGTYVTYDVEGCYWERLDAAGEIIDNNFISAAPRVEVTIRATDYAFNSEDCALWVQTDF